MLKKFSLSLLWMLHKLSIYKKSIPIILGFLFVCLVSTSYLPENQSKESGAIKVVIADRVFKIPKGYLDGRKATGKDTESIVLEYSLPGFEVLPKHPQERSARQQLIKEGRMRGMLIENSDKRPSFDKMVENSLNIKTKYKPPYSGKNEQIYGLQKYPSQKIHPDLETQYDDLYIERGKNGEVISFLRCSAPKQDKYPSCTHKFRDKGLLYQIHWSKNELPNWKKQREAAVKFIDSMEFKSEKGD